MTLLDEITLKAYNDYAATVNWKAYNGSPMLEFEAMRPLQRTAWRRAVETAVTEYVLSQARPEIPTVLTHWALHSTPGVPIPRTRDPEVVAYMKASKSDGPDAA